MELNNTELNKTQNNQKLEKISLEGAPQFEITKKTFY